MLQMRIVCSEADAQCLARVGDIVPSPFAATSADLSAQARLPMLDAFSYSGLVTVDCCLGDYSSSQPTSLL